MKPYTLIYDGLAEDTVLAKIKSLFGEIPVFEKPYQKTNPSDLQLPPESRVITYLSDEDLASLVAQNQNQRWTYGILPHPELKEARIGFGLAVNLADAVQDILNHPKGIKADLLLCNGQPVFNKLVIGNTLSLLSGSVSQTRLGSAWEKLRSLLFGSKMLVPRAFTIAPDNKQPITTAAVGIIAVLHGKSTLFSRKVLEDSYINDGRLHCLVLAPKSVTQLVRFLVVTMFRRRNRLPSFIGHIKTTGLTITSPEPMDFSLDNALMSAREIELQVSRDSLSVHPGRFLTVQEKPTDPQEQYRINSLPKGESYLEEIVGKPLSFIYHASTSEFKDLFQVLRENSRSSSSFLTLMVLSTLLATFGLFSNSSPVIIGAMILAPLMAPIISLSMGVLRQDRNLLLNSAKTIGLGLLLSYVAAILVTLITPLQVLNAEISGRIRPNLLDLGIAIVSGVAGAYAHAREEVAKTLAGVAIAVALVPPLAVSGIGIGWADYQVFSGALLLFLTNLTGIVLAGSVTFMLLGFSPFHLAKKGLLVSLLIVSLVSLPLGFGFTKMVRDHQIMRSLNNQTLGDITIRQVEVVRGGSPLVLRVLLLADDPINVYDLDQVKQAIAKKVGREVELEVTISIRR